MPVRLRLECDSTADAESLHRWLRREQAVRVDGELTRGGDDDPELMGTLLDVLTLVIGSGLSAGQLAVDPDRLLLPQPAMQRLGVGGRIALQAQPYRHWFSPRSW